MCIRDRSTSPSATRNARSATARVTTDPYPFVVNVAVLRGWRISSSRTGSRSSVRETVEAGQCVTKERLPFCEGALLQCDPACLRQVLLSPTERLFVIGPVARRLQPVISKQRSIPHRSLSLIHI